MSVIISAITFFGYLAFSSAFVAVPKHQAVTGVEWIEQPAPWYDCQQNGAFPHEENCQLLYDCYEDVAWLGRCTDMQLFDLKYSGCNYAAQVNCGDRTRPEGYPSEPFECPAPFGYFADPNDCRKFIECANNVPYSRCCQESLVYNDAVTPTQCDYRNNVNCGTRPIPEGECRV